MNQPIIYAYKFSGFGEQALEQPHKTGFAVYELQLEYGTSEKIIELGAFRTIRDLFIGSLQPFEELLFHDLESRSVPRRIMGKQDPTRRWVASTSDRHFTDAIHRLQEYLANQEVPIVTDETALPHIYPWIAYAINQKRV